MSAASVRQGWWCTWPKSAGVWNSLSDNPKFRALLIRSTFPPLPRSICILSVRWLCRTACRSPMHVGSVGFKAPATARFLTWLPKIPRAPT